jgi:hypothetical protein
MRQCTMILRATDVAVCVCATGAQPARQTGQLSASLAGICTPRQIHLMNTVRILLSQAGSGVAETAQFVSADVTTLLQVNHANIIQWHALYGCFSVFVYPVCF